MGRVTRDTRKLRNLGHRQAGSLACGDKLGQLCGDAFDLCLRRVTPLCVLAEHRPCVGRVRGPPSRCRGLSACSLAWAHPRSVPILHTERGRRAALSSGYVLDVMPGGVGDRLALEVNRLSAPKQLP
jgi:hypothetical protein